MTMAQMMAGAMTPGQQQPAAGGGAAPAHPTMETTTCPEGHVVAQGARFCPECGSKMPEQPASCPNGHPLPPGARFCPECGSQMG
jgi:membrane protease subunit (stomatin/prohibitin family)